MSQGQPAETKSRGDTGTGARALRWLPVLVMLALLLSPFANASIAAAQTGTDGLDVSGQPAEYRLQVNTLSNRFFMQPLDSAGVLSGKVQFSVTPAAGVARVSFYVDPTSGDLQTIEAAATVENAPFMFGGAGGFDTTSLANGPHTFAALIQLTDGTTISQTAHVMVYHGEPALLFGAAPLHFRLLAGQASAEQVRLLTSDGRSVPATISSDVSWLRSDVQANAPGFRRVQIDAQQLAPGVYTATLTASAEGLAPATTSVTVEVTGGQARAAAECTPWPCGEIKVDLPYVLDWTSDEGKIKDRNGVGTGFTYVDKPSNGIGYLPENLVVDTSGVGTLNITTNGGIMYQGENTQDNALGVGIAAPNQITVLETTLVDLPALSGNYEQAGLWFGNDEDNYVKLVVVSEPTGVHMQYLLEIAGAAQSGMFNSPNFDATGASVTLRLRANPADRTITAYYTTSGGALAQLGQFVVPGEFFSFDAAGIDPTIGTRSFGGIFATDRYLQGTTEFKFDKFSVTSDGTPQQGGLVNFDRSTIDLQSYWPTSMTFGPDGKLYVAHLFGKFLRITLNAQRQADSIEEFPVGDNMVLGLTIDPASTSDNVIVWTSFSGPQMDNGALNSGGVRKFTGPSFATQEDVITGLPRAVANHATNAIHFGPDGKLYIAQAGNTGAGAPNTANTEFGTRAEQPLSAALLVADVKNPNFDGTCATPENSFGPSPCDVQVYSSGMRNTYDFVIHSNGNIYGPDNGLGVVGTYPPQPAPDCTGLSDPAVNNPGSQPDVLNLLEQGKYYGHPNPYRNECVFKDGHWQGVQPLPNYMAPIFVIGMNTSSDGIIEYKSDVLNGLLKGSLLFTNYSVGDNVMRVKLTPDGRGVLDVTQLVGGFNNPLPLTEAADGTLYVGELEPHKIQVLVPQTVNPLGSWTTAKPLPSSLLDAGGAVIGGKLYMVAGKNGSSGGGDTYQRSLYIFDAAANTWSMGTPLLASYPAVENPAVAALDGKLYMFGGSTAPFSDAVANAAVYDPATATWTELAPLPVARGGATAQALDGKIYIAGGMDTTGASMNDLLIYDPTTDTYSDGPTMGERRDNPGSAVLGGKLYVFGGRTRNATGDVNPTLNSVEMFDPATNTWTPRAPMPTGRRTMVVGTLNGKAQVMGGERSTTTPSGTFSQNEEYDPLTNEWRSLTLMPTGRHGAVAGTIDNRVYVVAGGNQTGSSYTTLNEVFSFEGGPVTQQLSLFLPLIFRQ